MREKRTLLGLRNQYDTAELLDAIDALDEIRSLIADGPNLEPPEIRSELLRLHGIAQKVVNEDRPLSEDPDENLLVVACELECTVGQIRDAADRILDALGDIIRLCPDEDELSGEDDEKEQF